MSAIPTAGKGQATTRRPGVAVGRGVFTPVLLLGIVASVFAPAVGAWHLWRLFPWAQSSSLDLHLRLGIGTALIVVLLTVLRGEHRLGFYVAGENHPRRTLSIWNAAIAVAIGVAFLSRRADELSRGAVVLFYAGGFVGLWLHRSATSRLTQAANRAGILVERRILVVGTEAGAASFLRRYQPRRLGYDVVGTGMLSEPAAGGEAGLAAELGRAVELARDLRPDDVFIALPWSDSETIDRCIEAFLTTPVTIHLAPERVLDRFDQVTIARIGAKASLELTRPMSGAATLLKRATDIVAASAGLVLLAPLLATVALLVKLDGAGPVLFLQTRYGFNQRPFRIIKFRTMTTFADAGHVPQARRGDARITRVGAWLRRTNIDELPQLVNVLIGQMSLVGPRPHAVPHNRSFERRIALYARRHNVRPGITGWAQVNGLRGETDTDDKMRRRVECDLFYIDNWSMLLDLRIILRTVFSSRVYENAY